MTRRGIDLPEVKRPKCKACGASMMLVRRTPDPDHGARHELWTFMCFKCKRERTVPTHALALKNSAATMSASTTVGALREGLKDVLLGPAQLYAL
jgi:hypothetical protein